MKRTTFIKAISTAAAMAALAPTASFADGGVATVTQVGPASLTVLSNGSGYTKIDLLGNIGIQARLEFDTGTAGRIKSWTMTPTIENTVVPAAIVGNLSAYKASQSYSSGNRPKEIDRYITMYVPVAKLQNAAVGMCNANAQILRNQGKSDHWIFGRNHQVAFKIDVNAKVDSNGAGSSESKQIWEASPDHIMTINCAKWDGPQVEPGATDLKAPVSVSKATMQLKEVASLSGTCRVDTTTAIVASEANATIKYRFVHNSGKKSKVYSATTKGNKIAVISHNWDIPNTDGLENGWIRIEGTSPGFQSNRAKYSMNCKAKAPGGKATGPSKPKAPSKLAAPTKPSQPKGPSKLKKKPSKPKLKLNLKSN